jgi:GNAT superfamily N-acetyltransferase
MLLPIEEVPVDAIGEFLSAFAAETHWPSRFAASLGHRGPAGYAALWAALARGEMPAHSLVRTDTLLLVVPHAALPGNGGLCLGLTPPGQPTFVSPAPSAVVTQRVVGEVRVRHRLSERLLVQGGHIGYVVRPDERNRGYATALLRAGLARAAELGIDPALVTVDVTNAPSVRVVEKCGGTVIDVVPW